MGEEVMLQQDMDKTGRNTKHSRRSGWWRWLLSPVRFTCVLACGLLLLPSLVFGGCSSLQQSVIFPGTRLPPAPLPEHVSALPLMCQDGQVMPACLHAPDCADAPVVVFFHGNYMRLADCASIFAMYRQLGWGVAAVEFREYAGAPGPLTQAQLTADGVSLVREVRARYPQSPIILHGLSIGGFVAAQVAGHLPEGEQVDGLVLEHTGHSVAEMTWRFLVPAFLCRYPFRTGRVLSDMQHAAVLIVHGTEDEIFSMEHANQNHAAAQAAGLSVRLVRSQGVRHNDPDLDAALLGEWWTEVCTGEALSAVNVLGDADACRSR